MENLSLNGTWKMRRADGGEWHQAAVPGSVYADLLADGSMPDPYWRDNELQAFELMRHGWEYTRSFGISEAQLTHRRVILQCKGLDTLAHVQVNGISVGDADNMHICWEWEIRNLLHPGENTVTVSFDSPVEPALAAYEKAPLWCSTDAVPGFPFIRKAHCMYGWDWGPRLPDAGIWRDIGLLLVDEGRIGYVPVEQEHENGQVTLKIRPAVDGDPGCRTEVTVVSPDGTRHEAKGGTLTIEHPRLWWPRGYGNQPLYTVETRLYSADGRLLDTHTQRIGLRTMTVSREKDQWGEEFCHVVNGVKIFAMGGDYIPEDNILSRVTPERTRSLLQSAADAHFNTIRVWGGGYYPNDFFYDICDELGLLVWQDLMYACAFYDLTPAFEASIRRETEQVVRRIANHACLALICGNNEMEQFMEEALRTTMQGDLDTNGPKRWSHYTDYVKMFERLLPDIVRREAPQVFWWPASPSSGGNFDCPTDPNRGDSHYWDVWHGEKPFTDYRKYYFRYASEFGFQSFPCLKTVESFTLPEDRNIFSRVMERHQRNSSANSRIMAYMGQTFRYPCSFDDLLYASQLLQAEAIRYGVEHWRRHRGRCMGAVIWQLNDIWPVASWASIDYFGRWKVLHYAAKRFFAPVLLSCEEHGELDQHPKVNEFHTEPIDFSFRLNTANETMQPCAGTASWALRDPRGNILKKGSSPVEVPALSTRWLENVSFPDLDPTAAYVSYRLTDGEGKTVSEGTSLFCAPKHFLFEDPELQVTVEGDRVTVRASAYARQVWIESEDPDLRLEDNGFDMNAGERSVRVLQGSTDGLRVRSVYNLGR